jgi:hypothetical protein
MNIIHSLHKSLPTIFNEGGLASLVSAYAKTGKEKAGPSINVPLKTGDCRMFCFLSFESSCKAATQNQREP